MYYKFVLSLSFLTYCVKFLVSGPACVRKRKLDVNIFSTDSCFIHQHNPSNIDSSCDSKLHPLSDYRDKPVQIRGLTEIKQESDLILTRAGIFNSEKFNIENMRICSKHLRKLGRLFSTTAKKTWNNKIECIFPTIPEVQGVKLAHPDLIVNKEQSEVLWLKKHIFVPAGSIICKQHYLFLKDLVATEQATDAGLQCSGRIKQNRYQPCPSDLLNDDEPATEFVDPNQEEVYSEPNEIIQQNIRIIADEARIAEVYFTREFKRLTVRTKKKRANVAKKLCATIVKELAFDAPDEILDLMKPNPSSSNKYSWRLFELISVISDAVSNAQSTNVKYQILSIIAPFIPYNELVQQIPDVTPYSYKRARQYALQCEAGTYNEEETVVKERYDSKKVEAFIAFITSPHIVVDMPYGMKKVKMTSGIVEEIPNLIRIMNSEHIIDQYEMILKENEEEHLALSRSSMRRILKACTASTRKTLQGLDYFTFSGTEGFETLQELSKNLPIEDDEWKKDIHNRLHQGKQYLKHEFKLMVDRKSNVQDYCISFALSDFSKPELMESCSDHTHTSRSSQCALLDETLKEIKHKTELSFANERDMDDALYVWSNAYDGIMEWKKHMLRAVHQESAKTDILEALRPNEAFVQIDWAMKWIPAAGREDQTSWFGKRGIPWHIAVAVAKTGRNEYETHTYVHIFDQSSQDAETVIAIIRDVMIRLHKETIPITKVYLRSDNAGCYHGSQTIVAMPKISEETEVNIARWDFSDPQAGKGPCDRAAASIKRQIRMYMAENHACRTAEEFLSCASAHGRIKHTTFILAALQPNSDFKKASIPKINLYNNFQFSSSKITGWRAYNIGTGVPLQPIKSKTEQSVSKLTVKNAENLDRTFRELDENGIDTWKKISVSFHKHSDPISVNTDDHLSESTTDQEPATCIRNVLFSCPEEGCSRMYQKESHLSNHILYGRHNFKSNRLSLRDSAIDHYKTYIDKIQLFQSLPTVKKALNALATGIEDNDDTTPDLPVGWAFRSTRPPTVFSQKQRSFLLDQFNSGINTNKKKDPQDVAKAMRMDLTFSKEEWLSAQQIRSYFSRQAQIRRNEIIPVSTEGNNEVVDEDEDMLNPDPYNDDADEQIRQSIESQKAFVKE